MNFTSDNVHGAAPEILAALSSASSGTQTSYGDDDLTKALKETMSALFEREVAVFPVVSGTAANALALATFVPPHGTVVCHADAHIAVDECGAPEFFTHGAKLVTLDGANGKLSAGDIAAAISRFPAGVVHHSQPSAVSITQSSEWGTCYTPDEVAAIADVAHGNGLTLHMDGARFANAVAHLGLGPADASWRAGVDVLSFGATKNGALAAEAVIVFDPADVRDFEYRRKKSGHLVSKMRFLSAQWLAYLEADRWIDHARKANAAAATLARLLGAIRGIDIACPVEANAVFAWVPDRTVARLRAAGARFYDWRPSAQGRTLIRLVCSFATADEDVRRFAQIADSQ
ncbi:MAG: beta-eliminating lyase-related protein [Rhizomicrobium sp.]|jgi:threonine aldolase